jgi:hypothetical protein
MKISLVIDADTVEEFVAAIEAIQTRPVKVRPFAAPAVEAAPKPEPVVPTEPVMPTQPGKPKPTEPEPAAAVVAEAPSTPAAPVEGRKPRGRPKKVTSVEATGVALAPAPAPTIQAPPVDGPWVAPESQREMLGQVFGAYVRRYGTGVGYSDVSKLLSDNFGTGVRKQSDVTDANLAKAIAVVSGAIEANPFQRRRADVQ